MDAVEIDVSIAKVCDSLSLDVFDQCRDVAFPTEGVFAGTIGLIRASRIAQSEKAGLIRAMWSVTDRARYWLRAAMDLLRFAELLADILKAAAIDLNWQVVARQAAL
jgi:hypothetical protein